MHGPSVLSHNTPQALVDRVRAETAAALRERLRRLQDVEARARAALLPAAPLPAAGNVPDPEGPAPAGAAAAAPAAAAERESGGATAHDKPGLAGCLGEGSRLGAERAPAGSPPAAALAQILTPAGGNGAGSPGRSGTPPQVPITYVTAWPMHIRSSVMVLETRASRLPEVCQPKSWLCHWAWDAYIPGVWPHCAGLAPASVPQGWSHNVCCGQAPPLGPPRAGRHSATSSWDALEAESLLARGSRGVGGPNPRPNPGPNPSPGQNYALSRLLECSAAAEAGRDGASCGAGAPGSGSGQVSGFGLGPRLHAAYVEAVADCASGTKQARGGAGVRSALESLEPGVRDEPAAKADAADPSTANSQDPDSASLPSAAAGDNGSAHDAGGDDEQHAGGGASPEASGATEPAAASSDARPCIGASKGPRQSEGEACAAAEASSNGAAAHAGAVPGLGVAGNGAGGSARARRVRELIETFSRAKQGKGGDAPAAAPSPVADVGRATGAVPGAEAPAHAPAPGADARPAAGGGAGEAGDADGRQALAAPRAVTLPNGAAPGALPASEAAAHLPEHAPVGTESSCARALPAAERECTSAASADAPSLPGLVEPRRADGDSGAPRESGPGAALADSHAVAAAALPRAEADEPGQREGSGEGRASTAAPLPHGAVPDPAPGSGEWAWTAFTAADKEPACSASSEAAPESGRPSASAAPSLAPGADGQAGSAGPVLADIVVQPEAHAPRGGGQGQGKPAALQQAESACMGHALLAAHQQEPPEVQEAAQQARGAAGRRPPERPLSGGAAVDAALADWAAFPAVPAAGASVEPGEALSSAADAADPGRREEDPGNNSCPEPGAWVAFPAPDVATAGAQPPAPAPWAPDLALSPVRAHSGSLDAALAAAARAAAQGSPEQARWDAGQGACSGAAPGAAWSAQAPQGPQPCPSGNPFAPGMRGSASAQALQGMAGGGRGAVAAPVDGVRAPPPQAGPWAQATGYGGAAMPPLLLPSSFSLPSLGLGLGFSGAPAPRQVVLTQASAPPELAASLAAAAAAVPHPGREAPAPPASAGRQGSGLGLEFPALATLPARPPLGPSREATPPPSQRPSPRAGALPPGSGFQGGGRGPLALLWPGGVVPVQQEAEAAALAAWPPMSAGDRAKCQHAYEVKVRRSGRGSLCLPHGATGLLTRVSELLQS